MKKNILVLLLAIGLYHVSLAQTSPNEKRALDYIQSQAKELQINPGHSFKLYAVRKDQAGEILRFQQMLNGVPVYGCDIVVDFDPSNDLVYSSNSYDKSIAIIDVIPAITSDQAILAANKALNAVDGINFQQSKLFVVNLDGATKLAYRISTQINDKPGDWEVFVDAKSGMVLSAKDVSLYHKASTDGKKKKKKEEDKVTSVPFFKAPFSFTTGTAMVYDPDPLSVTHQAYAGNYVDNNDVTNAQLDAARTSVSLQEIDLTAGIYRLKSSYVDIADFEAPNKGLFTQATNAFNFSRDNDAFEAVNAFYHMDKSMRYINSTLGIVCKPTLNGGVFRFDPSGLSGADNSHYIPSSEQIAFGEGGVDDAEDADVMLHEFGHAIHDWITNKNSSSATGLGEGSGDYWAMSYSRSLNQWTTADAAYHWVFSWDGHNEWWGGRVTNVTATYPQTGGTNTEIHTYGQIWATALMKIYDVIGRTKTDKAFLQGLALTGSSTNQPQAAVAVRQAAINMNYPCADIQTMTDKFNQAGYNMPAVTTKVNCPGNQTVTAGPSNTYSMTSYVAQTNVISAGCAATATQNPTVGTSLSPGTYTVTMTSSPGTASCTFQLTVQPFLGIEDFAKHNLKIYPNPASSKLTISGDAIANQIIEIYNLLGQKVMQTELLTDSTTLDVSKLATGVYSIRFKDYEATYKFVKE